MQFTQIIGMARYEFRMHWRRRNLIVALLTFIVLNLMVLLVTGESGREFVEMYVNDAGRSPDIGPFFWIMIYFVILALLVPIVAETIPLDRQHGVRELLDSLPLSRDTYLLGKLLGMFLAVLACLAVGMLVIGVSAWLVIGSYDVGLYLRMWLIGALPIALINTGLSLFLAAGQPGRRRAALVGAVFAVLSLMLFASRMEAAVDRSVVSQISDLLSPARPLILLHFIPRFAPTSYYNVLIPEEIALSVLVGVVELLGLAVAIWWWMGWRASRT